MMTGCVWLLLWCLSRLFVYYGLLRVFTLWIRSLVFRGVWSDGFPGVLLFTPLCICWILRFAASLVVAMFIMFAIRLFFDIITLVL